MAIRSVPLLAALLVLTGCGSANSDSGPGGVTANEAKALDDAAEMVERQRLPEDALRPPAATPSAAHSAPEK